MPDLVPRPSRGRVFTGARRVRLADVSPAGRLRLDAAARFLQDLSADDTADAALPDAEAWVVRKTVMEVATFPRYLEPLELVTWCSGTGSHWAERRISIVGQHGGAIEAATTWVHIDMGSGRPSRIPASFDDLYGEAHGGRKVKARLDHPDPPTDVVLDRFTWSLRFSDFDVLGHVNNAACWQMVEEALARHRDLRAPLVAEVQHRTAIERGQSVEVVTSTGDGWLSMWALADGSVAVTAHLSGRTRAPRIDSRPLKREPQIRRAGLRGSDQRSCGRRVALTRRTNRRGGGPSAIAVDPGAREGRHASAVPVGLHLWLGRPPRRGGAHRVRVDAPHGTRDGRPS